MNRCAVWIPAIAGAALASAVLAQAPGQRLRDSAADAIDFSRKPLEELPLKLPAGPKPTDLLAFDPGKPTTMTFYVDPASLTVGTDGVVRYTIVARGDGTAMNVAYEGIRCKTRERKTFAYGRPDGSWYEPREPKWDAIGHTATDAPRFTLYQEYFCPSRQIIATAQEGIDALRRGGHPRATDLLTGVPVPK